jgi:hypothetical protein
MVLFQPTHDSKYVFEISRITNGNFKNLWQLKIATPEIPELTELVDADSLSTVMGKINYVLERDGF